MYKPILAWHTITIIGPPPLMLLKIRIILNPPLIKIPGLCLCRFGNFFNFLLSKRGNCYILSIIMKSIGSRSICPMYAQVRLYGICPREYNLPADCTVIKSKDGKIMALLEQWRAVAYNEATGRDKLQKLWNVYFQEEKEIYAKLLKNPDETVKGTVKELAEKYGVTVMTMAGFLDGINDSLKEPNPIEEMEEDTEVNLGFDKALLYKNMVAAEADWLYNLEEWNDIFDEDTRKALYKEQKSSTTIVKEQKIYPNDLCPCGSGKKYKKCCGKK